MAKAESPEELLKRLKEEGKRVNKKVKPYSHIKHTKSFSFQRAVEWYKQKYRKSKYFLVVMNTRNDRYFIFSVAVYDCYFLFGKGAYYIDMDMAKVDINSGLPVLFYHEDCSVPFKLNFSLDELMTKVSKDDKQITLALNPNNLKGFINSQVIEKVLKGQELTDDMRMLKRLVVINLIVTAIIGLIMARSLGWF